MHIQEECVDIIVGVTDLAKFILNWENICYLKCIIHMYI